MLDGKSTKEVFNINLEAILGSNYTTNLEKIGITFDEEKPVFTSIFLDTHNSGLTISSANYTYDNLVELAKISVKQIDPLKKQMENLNKILQRISSNLQKIHFKFTDEEKADTSNKYILETLPNQITLLVGIYQKLALAGLAYDYKVADVIKSIIEAFKAHK